MASKGEKVSGNKAELIERLKKLYSYEELNNLDFKKIFTLTSKGREMANITPLSLSCDHVFEKECIQLIMSGKINEAYKKVCIFQSKKPALPGINVDWANLDPESYYNHNEDILKTMQSVKTQTDPKCNALYNAMFIFCNMLGGHKITEEYLRDWIPEYYTVVSEKELLETAKRENDRYKNFDYPDFIQDFGEENICYIRNIEASMYLTAGYKNIALPAYEKSISEGWSGSAIYIEVINIYKQLNMSDAVQRIEARLDALEDNYSKKFKRPKRRR